MWGTYVCNNIGLVLVWLPSGITNITPSPSQYVTPGSPSCLCMLAIPIFPLFKFEEFLIYLSHLLFQTSSNPSIYAHYNVIILNQPFCPSPPLFSIVVLRWGLLLVLSTYMLLYWTSLMCCCYYMIRVRGCYHFTKICCSTPSGFWDSWIYCLRLFIFFIWVFSFIVVVCSDKSMCMPSFVLIGCGLSELNLRPSMSLS